MNKKFRNIFIPLCVITFAFNSTASLAESSKSRAERIAIQKIESEFGYKIPKNMAKKLNAIQWKFGASKNVAIMSGKQYALVNLAINRALVKYKRIRKPANLGFKKINSKKAKVTVIKRGRGQIRYGDFVALKLKKYGYLRYHNRHGWATGVNIGAQKNLSYNWKIGGGIKGQKLVSGMPFVLNLWRKGKDKGDIIYCQRTYGIDLGFRGRSKCGGTWAKISGYALGPNGILSGGGLKGKIAKKWKRKLCKAAITAGSAYVLAQTGAIATPAVAIAKRKSLNKCNRL